MSPSGFCNIEIVEPRDPFVRGDTHAYTIIPNSGEAAHSPLRPRGVKGTIAAPPFAFVGSDGAWSCSRKFSKIDEILELAAHCAGEL